MAREHVYKLIFPMRGQMVLFRCERQPFKRVLNDGPRYLVPRGDGYVLAGSTEEEAGFDKSITAEAIAELTRFAIKLVPALRDATIEQTWAGLRPASYDGFPYIGRMPGLENAFVAAGHFRSGLHLSPGTAVVLADLMCGNTPAVDLTPFRVSRG
jgi:glycine oxidase